jgi:hypothetical protein
MNDVFARSSPAAQTARDLTIRRKLLKRSPRTRCGENHSGMPVHPLEVRSFAVAQDNREL